MNAVLLVHPLAQFERLAELIARVEIEDIDPRLDLGQHGDDHAALGPQAGRHRETRKVAFDRPGKNFLGTCPSKRRLCSAIHSNSSALAVRTGGSTTTSGRPWAGAACPDSTRSFRVIVSLESIGILSTLELGRSSVADDTHDQSPTHSKSPKQTAIESVNISEPPKKVNSKMINIVMIVPLLVGIVR